MLAAAYGFKANGMRNGDRPPVFSFSMRASGRYRDTDHTLDFTAKARLFKEKTIAGILTRIVTFPFSKLLEFRVYGTADNPEWSYIGILDRVIDFFAGDSEEEGQ